MRIVRFLFCIVITFQFQGSFCSEFSIDSLLTQYNNKEELNDSLYSDVLYRISLHYVNIKPDSSILFSKELVSMSTISKDYHSLYRGHLSLGNAHRIKGNLDNAVEHYFHSIKAADNINYLKGKGIVYTALGDAYAGAKNQKNAVLYYNKAIDILRSQGDQLSLAITLLNIGAQYNDFNLVDTGIVYLKESKEIFESLNYEIGIAYNYGNMGNAYAKQGMFIEAEKNFHKASSILIEYGDTYSLSAFNANLADAYIGSNQFDKALKPANKAYAIALQNGLLSQVRDAAKNLSVIYNELGDYKNAYHYQSQYITYRDSINNEETIRKMADLRTEYEVAQKQVEVEKAQAQLELETKRRQNQQIIGIGLIVVILLTGALSYVLFRNAKREKYVNKILREQKEEMRIQRDMLEEVNNTKDRFFSIISHDLRGPIGVLNGTTMLIREFLESKDYHQLDELTSNMEYSVKKVQNLLDNLLEWAVSQRGQYNYFPEKVELNKVMLETISVFSDMAQAKSITLSYEQKYAEAFITVDRNSLTTILRNLISNALKFTNKMGNVDVIVDKEETETKIMVKDTGVGIPQDKINTLFDIEAKKSTWGTDREKGLGIGLNLVYEFVKMNKGDIKVESILGVGTTFIITLPTQLELADIENARFI